MSARYRISTAVFSLFVAACGGGGQAPADPPAQSAAATAQPPEAPGRAELDRVARDFPDLAAQVALDRMGFSPGVIDGKGGASFRNAVRGLQEANGIQPSGAVDPATRALLDRQALEQPVMRVRVDGTLAARAFRPLPDGAAEQAKLTELGYESLWEALAERFHTTPEVLQRLNGRAAPDAPSATRAPGPSATGGTTAPSGTPPIGAGDMLLVPAIEPDLPVATEADPAGGDDSAWIATRTSLGVGRQAGTVARIEVDKSEGVLRAFGEDGRLLMLATATMGSEHDPLPLGEWTVKGVARNPPFAYDPDLFWDVPDNAEDQQLPPGPNGPVGVVWIDLSKEHYGIHGTAEPQTIGTAESHGCVRLTNWDAARLAEMVKPGVEVHFRA